MKRKQILAVVFVFAFLVAACVPSPPNPGFRVTTTITRLNFFFFPETALYPHVGIFGTFVGSSPLLGIPTGTITAFMGNTGSGAYFDVNGGKAPAAWNMGMSNGFCAGQSILVLVTKPGIDFRLDCAEISLFFVTFTVSPAVIDVSDPPPSITISGSGISSAGGMPTIEYYDGLGTMIGQATAVQVAEDGTWLIAATPSLPSIGGGRYLVTIRNPDGAVAGNAFIEVFSYYEPPPDPEPDPCAPDQICPVLEVY